MVKSKLVTKLVPITKFVRDGKPYFKCRCDCGRLRDVLQVSYRNRNVTACLQCTKAGLHVRKTNQLRRVELSIDPGVMEALGLTESVTGAELRKWLRMEAARRTGVVIDR